VIDIAVLCSPVYEKTPSIWNYPFSNFSARVKFDLAGSTTFAANYRSPFSPLFGLALESFFAPPWEPLDSFPFPDASVPYLDLAGLSIFELSGRDSASPVPFRLIGSDVNQADRHFRRRIGALAVLAKWSLVIAARKF